MDVLVYTPSATVSPLAHTLRLLLSPFYTVQPVTALALATQPWAPSCALLVLHRGAGMSRAAAAAVQRYAEEGGRLLALGVGIGTAASTDFESQALRFFAPAARAYVYPSVPAPDAFESMQGEVLHLNSGEVLRDVRSAGVMFAETCVTPDTVLARWQVRKGAEAEAGDQQDHGAPAALDLSVGAKNGRVAFWDIAIDDASGNRSVQTLLTRAVAALGLSLPSVDSKPPSVSSLPPTHVLPQLLLAPPQNRTILPAILSALGVPAYPAPGGAAHVIKDAADTFHFEAFAPDVLEQARTLEDGEQVRRVLVLAPGELPSNEITPLFDVRGYFNALGEARKHEEPPTSEKAKDEEGWGLGEALIYGEVITSTQTMLDKNPYLLNTLPSPLLSLATHQLAGRGRGANTWLSPLGCLQFSLLLRVPLSVLPAARLVFVQYLFALAVVRACRDPRGLGGDHGAGVRLKWPNDIYIEMGGGERKKVGGILVHTSFSGGKVDLVVGCGLNVATPAPLASLALLAPPGGAPSPEMMLALIMTKFENMWEEFMRARGSWAPFADAYLDAWMHSDQLVTLTTVTPPRAVRIVGITPDHGLLRTLPERSAWSAGGSADTGFIDLQPDGNSFDLMAGLIKAKT